MHKYTYYILAMAACIFMLFSFDVLIPAKKTSVNNIPAMGTKFTAGDKIVFKLNSSGESNEGSPTLVLKSTYGTTVVSATYNKNVLTYTLPDFFSRKTGLVHWKLITDEGVWQQGLFYILPESKVTHVENYLGPRSMLTGDRHYTMMVAAPTDAYDNPKPEGTPVAIKSQFLENISVTSYPVKDFIAWKRIYSPEKSGKMLTSIACGGEESKETETDVYPNLPVNFKIGYKRNHKFADGNQLTTLATSEIRDKFGNVVADGTLVLFEILTNRGKILKTYGATISGVAEAKILAPERYDSYKVKAFVNGMGESSLIKIDYYPIKVDIEYNFSKGNRVLTVGEINSFMGQMAPDGTLVTIKVLHKSKEIETLEEFTNKGFTVFKFPKEAYKEKEYEFEIRVLGNLKKTGVIKYVESK
ncbi:hypothetical protein ACLI1A_19165 [Flavobacterium sp. RHBU_3]|uniref:hypothetical protein n=1 Tax=Flavobacterium sp. RHBU_3 TaxID=3391184 RepID=UPI003984B656